MHVLVLCFVETKSLLGLLEDTDRLCLRCTLDKYSLHSCTRYWQVLYAYISSHAMGCLGASLLHDNLTGATKVFRICVYSCTPVLIGQGYWRE
jgi:hypothetical protein